MDKSTSMFRLQVWTECVRECHNSGMTVKDWCGQNNINLKTNYGNWYRVPLRFEPGVIAGNICD